MPQQSLYGTALRGVFTSLGGEFLLKTLGVAATFITLHELSPYQYGLWQLLLGVVSSFGIVTFPGIASMLVAEVSREIGVGEARRAHGITVRAAALFVALSGLGALGLFVAAPFIKAVSGIHMVFLMQILSISVFAIGVRQVYALMYASHLKFLHSQAMKIADRIAYLIGVVVFVGIMGQGVDGVAYAYVLSSVAGMLVLAPHAAGMFARIFREHDPSDIKPFVRSAWGRGRWVLMTDAVNTATGSLWPWVAGFFLGVEAVGIIGVAVLVLGQVSSFVPISSMLRSVLPRTSHSEERMREWLRRSMKITFWGHTAAGAFVFVACAVVFPAWFPHYVAALPLLGALLPSLLNRGLSTTSAEWFYASGRQKELFLASGIPKVISFVLLPLFLYCGGLFGYAAWYLVLSVALLQARLYVVRVKTGLRIRFKDLFTPDKTDVELLERARSLVRGKVFAVLRR